MKKTVMLLGITVDNKIWIEPHFNEICKKLAKSSMSLQEFQVIFHKINLEWLW